MRVFGLVTVFAISLFAAFGKPGAALGTDGVSPELQAAIDAYLAGDDAAALPALLALAAANDPAAQTILGEIAHEPQDSWSEWRRALSGSERERFFGPPGATWVATAAGGGDPAAQALLAARGEAPTLDEVRALFAAGQKERAKTLAWAIMETGETGGVLTLSPDDPLYRGLDYFWWLIGWTRVGHESAEPFKWVSSSPAEGRAGGLVMANWLLQFIAPQKQLPEDLSALAVAFAGNPARLAAAGPGRFAEATGAAANLARRDPEFAPVGTICAEVCGEAERGACALDALRLLGGYDKLMRLDPPLETAIPARAFGRSARAAGMVRRMLAAAAPSTKGEPLSRCLAAAISP